MCTCVCMCAYMCVNMFSCPPEVIKALIMIKN